MVIAHPVFEIVETSIADYYGWISALILRKMKE